MKKLFYSVMIYLSLLGCLCSCKEETIKVDYENAIVYEKALNEGVDTVGKLVKFTVDELNPNSSFGYNIYAGEHLNFVSSTNPHVKVGDEMIVEILDVTTFLRSYIIKYDKLR
ncbi:MAG: hypothetical protein J1F32_01695 [Erysipelotrichales bacterium]|nr:hypothetical protein [Erysipelotrichales bacterium]